MNLKNKHSKKNDYVGDHGGAYLDGAGNSRQFTYIDHDKKPTLACPPTTEEISEAKKQLKEYREKVIETILSLSASAAPENFHVFTLRGEQGIRWDENMVKDPAIDLWTLVSLRNFVEDRINITD